MKDNNGKNIVGFLLPTVNDMKNVKENGLRTWLIIFIAKVVGWMIVLWFLIKIIGLHASV